MERRGGGSLNKEVEWRKWFSGTQGGGGSLNKEVEWRKWFRWNAGGGSLNKEVEWRQCLVERRGGEANYPTPQTRARAR